MRGDLTEARFVTWLHRLTFRVTSTDNNAVPHPSNLSPLACNKGSIDDDNPTVENAINY